jgi:hypothetical protein
LLSIASAAFRRSESHGPHEHTLLSLIFRLPQTGGPGSCIYFPQQQGSPFIPPDIGYLTLLTQPPHRPHRKHRFQQLYYRCVCVCCGYCLKQSFLQSDYLATGVLYLLISRSLNINRSTSHNMDIKTSHVKI